MNRNIVSPLAYIYQQRCPDCLDELTGQLYDKSEPLPCDHDQCSCSGFHCCSCRGFGHGFYYYCDCPIIKYECKVSRNDIIHIIFIISIPGRTVNTSPHDCIYEITVCKYSDYYNYHRKISLEKIGEDMEEGNNVVATFSVHNSLEVDESMKEISNKYLNANMKIEPIVTGKKFAGVTKQANYISVFADILRRLDLPLVKNIPKQNPHVGKKKRAI